MKTMRQLEFDDLVRGLAPMTPEERWGVRRVSFPDVGGPVPPEEIAPLLVSSPQKGLFELERAAFNPAVPFASIRKIFADAFDDPRTAPETKAEMLWRSNLLDACWDSAHAGCGDGPPFCLDSGAGRKWYCSRKMAGYEIVRCSSPVFFKRISGWCLWNLRDKFETVVKTAIEADSPKQFMIALALVGRRIDSRLLCCLLRLHKTKIVEWLIGNDDTAKELLGGRRMLFHVCATWPFEQLADYVEKAERANPGTIASCVDALGRNLLWYATYNLELFCTWSDADDDWVDGRQEEAEDLLMRLGADPDAPTKWGVSWRQLRDVRESSSCLYDFFLNGKKDTRGIESFTIFQPPQGEGDAHRFKIVLGGTGLEMEWAFPKELYPVAERATSRMNNNFGHVGAGYDSEIAVKFRDRPEGCTGRRGSIRAIFRRGPDRLFHFVKVVRRKG